MSRQKSPGAIAADVFLFDTHATPQCACSSLHLNRSQPFFVGVCAGQVLDVLARDTHYKYLPIMLISSGTGFVIANWVGWQYYRNS